MGYYETHGDKICRYVAWHWKNLGTPPSLRDVCKAVGIKSPGTMHRLLVALEVNGRLRKDPYKKTISVVEEVAPELCDHDWRITNLDFLDTGEAVVKCLKCKRKTAVEVDIDWNDLTTCPRYCGNV